ncbi:hypothetical protein MYAER_1322 [Microcystis aeruginosa NIES-2549]|uniref:Uncharacterized protein n=1 Tax=Microcystis aeruginosa NIES-2549 TaxID=1641812 RepID=A0A0F6RKA7_MICAE|nr:hypothetical protein MYAER_1322 [Microcystis aeruginosa NIES-2549]AOC52070.1 hypothetical protein amyaer_1335 [Microcystis aeruginosa NIES-2481]
MSFGNNLGNSYQLSVISYQESVISYQIFYPHTPHPTSCSPLWD